jgi:hypothetical protein
MTVIENSFTLVEIFRVGTYSRPRARIKRGVGFPQTYPQLVDNLVDN